MNPSDQPMSIAPEPAGARAPEAPEPATAPGSSTAAPATLPAEAAGANAAVAGSPLAASSAFNSNIPKIVRFDSLARCGDEIWIENEGQIYRLRRTRQGKLILTK